MDPNVIVTHPNAVLLLLCHKGVAGFTIEARLEAHNSNTRTPTNPGRSTKPPIRTHPEAGGLIDATAAGENQPTLTSSSKRRRADVPLPPKDFTIFQFLAVCNITPDSKE
ncbi:hypothetical protein PtB15_13B94 [Puccinia triticina]|nr:hypothetical protein PtB15_13B94 [Puccinia triticina]